MRLNETLHDINIREENGNKRRVNIGNVKISCYYPQGTFIMEDVICNSQFML